MPNIVAHNHIANILRPVPQPDNALGSVLPDFRHMYRDMEGQSIEIQGLSAALDWGIRVHKDTDFVFNRQDEVLEMQTHLTEELLGKGLKPQAARMAAHFLTDVMPDAALLRDIEALTHFDVLEDSVLDRKTALDKGLLPKDFSKGVIGFFAKGKAKDYKDPKKLAKIARDRVNARARNAGKTETRSIHDNETSAVAEVIKDQYGYIAELGRAALYKTAGILLERRASY